MEAINGGARQHNRSCFKSSFVWPKKLSNSKRTAIEHRGKVVCSLEGLKSFISPAHSTSNAVRQFFNFSINKVPEMHFDSFLVFSINKVPQMQFESFFVFLINKERQMQFDSFLVFSINKVYIFQFLYCTLRSGKFV